MLKHDQATIEHDMNDAKIAGHEASKDTVKTLQARLDRLQSRLDRLTLTKEHTSRNLVVVFNVGAIGSMIMLFSGLAIAWGRRPKPDIAR